MANDLRIKRRLRKMASRYGRKVVAHNGHYRLEHPHLPPVHASGSPRDIDTMFKLVERDLRRSVPDGDEAR